MKIRNRLTWISAITAVIAITSLSLLVYYFTSSFHEREFFERLEERVALTELMVLEKNEEVEQAVRDKFLHTLEDEIEYVITLKPTGIDSLKLLFPYELSESILSKQKSVRFWQGDHQGVGTRYQLLKGEYVVVVTAVDTFGRSKLDFLRKILIAGGFISVLLLVFVYQVGLTNALKPLESKIQRASRISADHLDLRLEVKDPENEIGKVAVAFNRMLDRLQSAFEAQKQFVRNASHEMRNPLTAISGEAEVLLNKDRTIDEYKEALKVILRESDRLRELTSQLLDLQKAEALSELPNPDIFPLDQCLLEATGVLPVSRIQMDIDFSEEEYTVRGSFSLMRTALYNIMDNAQKYSENKPVHVSLSRLGDDYSIRIADQGIGIPEKDLKNISQPFFRSSNARKHNGHGIGLALVKKIISLHQGNMEFISNEGQGTTVLLRIPRS